MESTCVWAIRILPKCRKLRTVKTPLREHTGDDADCTEDCDDLKVPVVHSIFVTFLSVIKNLRDHEANSNETHANMCILLAKVI